jgi:class 3 adenylate cyclase
MADRDLVDYLRARGATEDQMAGLDDGDLIGLSGDLAATEGLDLTLVQLANRAGTDVDSARSFYRAVGLDPNELAGFGNGDVELLQLLSGDTTGMVEQVADELLRVAGVSLRRLAEATVAVYVQDVENQPGIDRADFVLLAQLNSLGSGLLVRFATQLGTLFRHHMFVAVNQQRRGQRELVEPRHMRVGIGFVDLVGYTPISGRLTPTELGDYIDAFETTAFEVAHRHGGRVVKSIGDEVMFTAPEPRMTAMIALDLVQAFASQHGTAPRGAISAGNVMFRLGDFYGPVVNLAARLVDAAEPGQVLTDLPVAGNEPMDNDLAFEPIGTRDLKGFEESVAVFEVRSLGPTPE